MTVHEYQSGGWTALVTDDALALLHPGVPDDVARELWQLTTTGRPLGAWVEYLASAGITALPSFAMVEGHPDGLRVLVRGEVDVEVAGQVVTGRGYTTWREEVLPAAADVTIRAEDVDGGWLPLTGGIVRSAAVRLAVQRPPSELAGTEDDDVERTVARMPALAAALGAQQPDGGAAAAETSLGHGHDDAAFAPPAGPAAPFAPAAGVGPSTPPGARDTGADEADNATAAAHEAAPDGAPPARDAPPADGPDDDTLAASAADDRSGDAPMPAEVGDTRVAGADDAGAAPEPAHHPVGAGSAQEPAGEGDRPAADAADPHGVSEADDATGDALAGPAARTTDAVGGAEAAARLAAGADDAEEPAGVGDRPAAAPYGVTDGEETAGEAVAGPKAAAGPAAGAGDAPAGTESGAGPAPVPGDPAASEAADADATAMADPSGAALPGEAQEADSDDDLLWPTEQVREHEDAQQPEHAPLAPADDSLPDPAQIDLEATRVPEPEPEPGTDPFAPGGIIDSVPGRPLPDAPVGVPVDLPPPGGFPAPQSPYDDGDHDGETIMTADLPTTYTPIAVEPVERPDPGVELVLSTGPRIEMDRPVLLGRAPEATRFAGTEAPRLVSVANPERDISATHVEIRPAGGHVVVTDMNSTNGTVIHLPDQPSFRLQPGTGVPVAAGAVVELGAGITVTVERLEGAR